MNDPNVQLDQIRQYLDMHSNEEILTAIRREDYSELVCLPENARHAIAYNPDLRTDVWWYVDIRNELELSDFPCVHMAYGMSSKTSNVVSRDHGVFSISTNGARTEGIVIGYCPWCAKPLDTDLKQAKVGTEVR